MNVLSFQQQGQDFTDVNSPDYSIQEQTEQLIYQVFNQKYQPVYNPTQTKYKQTLYKNKKKQQNMLYQQKIIRKQYGNRKIYQNLQDPQISKSFSQFLLRAQQKIDNRDSWLMKERQKKREKQMKTLKIAPQILRGSRQKILPLYERCIYLQKEKQKRLQLKRIEKSKDEANQFQKIPFKPSINPSNKQRTFQQYIAQKQSWKRQRDDQLEKKRIVVQVQRLNECTFVPQLIATYNKPNSRIIPGQSVQIRLLRSLQKSLSKQNKKL